MPNVQCPFKDSTCFSLWLTGTERCWMNMGRGRVWGEDTVTKGFPCGRWCSTLWWLYWFPLPVCFTCTWSEPPVLCTRAGLPYGNFTLCRREPSPTCLCFNRVLIQPLPYGNCFECKPLNHLNFAISRWTSSMGINGLWTGWFETSGSADSGPDVSNQPFCKPLIPCYCHLKNAISDGCSTVVL